MQSVVPTYQVKLLLGPTKASRGGADANLNSLGLAPDRPDGYLQLKQMTLGPEEAVITKVSSTGYSGSMRDDAYFTFVLQRAGRYDVQISGRDYGMSPGS